VVVCVCVVLAFSNILREWWQKKWAKKRGKRGSEEVGQSFATKGTDVYAEIINLCGHKIGH